MAQKDLFAFFFFGPTFGEGFWDISWMVGSLVALALALDVFSLISIPTAYLGKQNKGFSLFLSFLRWNILQ